MVPGVGSSFTFHPTQCIKYKTRNSIILGRFEALNLSLMRKMQNRAAPVVIPIPTSKLEGPAVENNPTVAPTTVSAAAAAATAGVAAAAGVKKKKNKKKK